MKKVWVLSYPLSAQRRLWSDSLCWFCHVAAKMNSHTWAQMEHITSRLITSWWRKGSVQILKLPEWEHPQVQMLEATLTWWWMNFQTRLKKSRKIPQPRIRVNLEKLNDPTVMSAFQEIRTSCHAGRLRCWSGIHDHPLQQGGCWHSNWTSWQATSEEETLG